MRIFPILNPGRFFSQYAQMLPIFRVLTAHWFGTFFSWFGIGRQNVKGHGHPVYSNERELHH